MKPSCFETAPFAISLLRKIASDTPPQHEGSRIYHSALILRSLAKRGVSKDGGRCFEKSVTFRDPAVSKGTA